MSNIGQQQCGPRDALHVRARARAERRLAYVLSSHAVIALLTCFPIVLWFAPDSESMIYLRALRVLRALRIFRLQVCAVRAVAVESI